MESVEVSRVNGHMNNLRKHSRDIEERKREEIDATAEAVAELVDDLATNWEDAGLSEREAEVAAYKQLGFTNKATAYMLDLSANTVNEYDRRASQKVEEARRLVDLAERTEALEKDWLCPDCREGIRRSHGDIEVSERAVSYTCRKCFNSYERTIRRTDR